MINLTTQGKERTFHRTKLTGHQHPRMKKVKMSKMKLTTTRMAIRLMERMPITGMIRHMEMKDKKVKKEMHSMMKHKTKTMVTNRTKMDNRKNMVTMDKNMVMKKAKAKMNNIDNTNVSIMQLI